MEKINNFEEYGFTSNLKGEILKVVDGWLIGYVQKYNEKPISSIWNSLNGINYDEKAFNLTPIKKKWYEDEENIGKLCVTKHTKEIFIMTSTLNIGCINSDRVLKQSGDDYCDVKHCRPATRGELLSLLIKE